MKNAFHIVVTILRKYPAQSVLMVLLLALASVLEVASISVIIPLLSQMPAKTKKSVFLRPSPVMPLSFLKFRMNLASFLS